MLSISWKVQALGTDKGEHVLLMAKYSQAHVYQDLTTQECFARLAHIRRWIYTTDGQFSLLQLGDHDLPDMTALR